MAFLTCIIYSFLFTDENLSGTCQYFFLMVWGTFWYTAPVFSLLFPRVVQLPFGFPFEGVLLSVFFCDGLGNVPVHCFFFTLFSRLSIAVLFSSFLRTCTGHMQKFHPDQIVAWELFKLSVISSR